MKCFYHENADSILTCSRCGKPLCQNCYDQKYKEYCNDCAEIVGKKILKKTKKTYDPKNEYSGASILTLILSITTIILVINLTLFTGRSEYILSQSKTLNRIFWFCAVIGFCVSFIKKNKKSDTSIIQVVCRILIVLSVVFYISTMIYILFTSLLV
jgi:hypothetical protein